MNGLAGTPIGNPVAYHMIWYACKGHTHAKLLALCVSALPAPHALILSRYVMHIGLKMKRHIQKRVFLLRLCLRSHMLACMHACTRCSRLCIGL